MKMLRSVFLPAMKASLTSNMLSHQWLLAAMVKQVTPAVSQVSIRPYSACEFGQSKVALSPLHAQERGAAQQQDGAGAQQRVVRAAPTGERVGRERARAGGRHGREIKVV